MINLLFFILRMICCFLWIFFWRSFLDKWFLICFWIVFFNGWVLYFRLMFFFVIFVFVVLVNLIERFCFFRCFVNWLDINDMILVRCFFLSEWKIMILLIWLINFGLNVCFNLFIILFFMFLWFCVLFWMLKLIYLLCFSLFVLMFDVIIRMVLWKLIVCFLELVNCLFLRICRRILKILGCVFLILLRSMIE